MERLVIITPCSRPQNLGLVLDSIRFQHVVRWIIVHDVTSRPFDVSALTIPWHPKIAHLTEAGGAFGNPQRNRALDDLFKSRARVYAPGIFVYFLDDDNVIHPRFWRILQQARAGYMYSFDSVQPDAARAAQEFAHVLRGQDQDSTLPTNVCHLKGNRLEVGQIDTAQVLMDWSLIGALRWECDRYDADGIFLSALYARHAAVHRYVPEGACYYNFLSRPETREQIRIMHEKAPKDHIFASATPKG